MASKSNVKPNISEWTKTRAKAARQKHNHIYDVGDLVTKYPGKIWEVVDLGYDAKKGNIYCLSREIGEAVKRWKSAWVSEKEISGAFVS